MINTPTRRSVLALSAALVALMAAPAFAQDAQTHVVQMLNKHPEDKKQRMVFHPRVIKIAPGDTVVFESTDKGHNSQSIKGMIPDGAEPWNSKINTDVEITFDQPGVYGYRCTPHAAMGMVGLVIVEGDGMLDNLDAAKSVKQRGRSKAAFEEIWQEADDAGFLSDSAS
ncbi:MAG: pseudoazurin [Marinibacterium sp.]|nr:pseudoazurin [Marinibacterium sp.]